MKKRNPTDSTMRNVTAAKMTDTSQYLTRKEMVAIMRERLRNLNTSQKDAASILGLSPQQLSNMLTGYREISDSGAKAFGYRRVVVFRPLYKGSQG